jgi:UDP-N-acetylglucosamine 1-carboxyvinyltransferase
VPHLKDVTTTIQLLARMGATVTIDERSRIEVDGSTIKDTLAPYELVERMRASIVVLGPLLSRFGRAKVSMPGGDNFGTRPIDMHLKGLELMGAEFDIVHGNIEARCDGLQGARIVLEFPSHTATDNLLMAAVLAKGTTIIENAAREPEVADLAAMLNRMGANVTGAGTSTIEVEGVDSLRAVEHTVIPDRIEAATWVAAVGIAGGEVTIEGARPDHMDMVIQKMGDMGVRVSPSSSGLWASCSTRLKSTDVATLPYPGIATDYKPMLVAMLAVADGVAIVTENIFHDNRFAYVAELNRMGADIRTEGHHAVVRGVSSLSGAKVKAHDVRAGIAVLLAGLVADGETEVVDAFHVDRGYDDFAGKLRSLGGDIERRR